VQIGQTYIIVVIRAQFQILEKVVCQGVLQIAAIELQAKELW